MPRRGENIYKRKDGRWEGRYIKGKVDKKTSYGYIYGKTYSEVKKKLQTAKATVIIHPKTSKSEDIDVETLINQWQAENMHGLKSSTIVKYENLLSNYIIPTIGEIPVSTLDYQTMTHFCNELLSNGGISQNGLSPKTVSDVVTLFKRIIKYGIRKKYCIDSSILDITVKIKQKNIRVLSKQEEHCLLSALDPYNNGKDIGILICLFSGIRIGELCALTWDDVSLSKDCPMSHSATTYLYSKLSVEIFFLSMVWHGVDEFRIHYMGSKTCRNIAVRHKWSCIIIFYELRFFCIFTCRTFICSCNILNTFQCCFMKYNFGSYYLCSPFTMLFHWQMLLYFSLHFFIYRLSK